MEKFIEIIKAELENHSEVLVGFRGLASDESYQIGDTPRESYEWDWENDCSTYYTTGETTEGTCAIGGWVSWLDEDNEVEEKLNDWQEGVRMYGDSDNFVFLVGTSEGDYGTRDENEVRIEDAKVLAYI